MNLVVYTLGCKLNQCEGEALASVFKDRGFSILKPHAKADIYIVNTCTVTSKAEQKARRMIQKFSREDPEAVVIVTGCYTEVDPRKGPLSGPRIRLVSQERKNRLLGLPEYLMEHSQKDIPLLARVDTFLETIASSKEEAAQPDPFAFHTKNSDFHSRAYLKFQDGCDNRCAYCRTTLARGPSVSLPWPEMRKRLINLEELGYREIVLTGVNIASYHWEEITFSDLLGKILKTMSRARIRLSSLEPESITQKMGEILRSPVFCPHFHISVQSCSDTVLQRMRRRGKVPEIRRAIKILRQAKDDPFIAADVIVGFPGETDREFQETYNLLEELEFTDLHVFPFSPRPGTEAEKMRNPIPERISRERTARLKELSRKLRGLYLKRQEGKVFDFVLEKPLKEGGPSWRGTSENYLKTSLVPAPSSRRRGAIVSAPFATSSQVISKK